MSSLLVNAIHVGLGGDIKLLRRQKELKDLIKNTVGKDENAVITIELHTGETEGKAHDIVECHIGSNQRFVPSIGNIDFIFSRLQLIVDV